MTKVMAATLKGAALDWTVATIEALPIRHDPMAFGNTANGGYWIWAEEYPPKLGYLKIGLDYSPSTIWSQGGPLIDSMDGFQLKNWLESNPETKCEAHIHNYEGDWIAFGPTPLIAAMRCLVKAKLGDEVDVPEELLPQQTH